MLLAWVMRKFKRFKAHKIRTSRFLQKLPQENAGLFVHWQLGMTGTFARWERCEARASRTVLREAGGEIPRPTHLQLACLLVLFKRF
jgi:hypothetical protein